MQLENAAGSRLDLTVVDYEFPDRIGNYHDDNWLMVRIEAASGGRAWTTVQPCLLTVDLDLLAYWLGNLQTGTPTLSQLEFTEPLLLFSTAATGAGQPALRVFFECESRPPWAPASAFPARDVWIDFPLAEIDFPRALASLTAQQRQFPQRT